jgi:radical SAM superfamily enzyme YgiQ (UPF0313 family)
MKVLLLNPPPYKKGPFVKEGRCQSRAGPEFWPPMTLATIASMLRDDHEIKLVDATVEDYKESDIIKLYKDFSPDAVIYNSTTTTFYDDLHAAELAKDLKKGVVNIFFGTHVTALAKDSLKNKAIDIVIRGEPEVTSKEILDSIAKKKNLKGIRGISYRSGKKIVSNPDRSFVENLDDLPYPARDLLKNELYKVPMRGGAFTIIRTSRGCPFKCIFCTSRLYYGNKWRTRTAKSVIDEIKEIKKLGIDNIFFNSDTFTFDRNFVLDLCGMIKEEELNIKWFCNSRVNTIDEEMAREMKSSGCWLISLGIESGNQKILNFVKKGIVLDQAKKTIRMLNKVGIETIAYFIFGLPGETKETIDETINFAKECNPTYARFYTAVPFPGTEFYEMKLKEGKIKSFDWSKYDQASCDIYEIEGLSPEDIVKAEKRAFMLFYFRPKYVLKSLKRPRSSFASAFSFFKEWVFSDE